MSPLVEFYLLPLIAPDEAPGAVPKWAAVGCEVRSSPILIRPLATASGLTGSLPTLIGSGGRSLSADGPLLADLNKL
jgi:hypothetical protein